MIRSVFTRVLTMIAKDARTGGRDQITTYMLLSPILLGLALALLMPILEDPRPSFAVSAALDEVHREALHGYGEIEVLADREAVERRVLARDDLIGIVADPAAPDRAEVIVEGDEPEGVAALARTLLDDEGRVRGIVEPVAGPDNPDDGGGASPLRLMITALLGFTITVIVGAMLGFAILEEKLTDTHRVLATSPLRFWEYMAAKLGLATVLTLIMVVPAIALPLGFDLPWGSIVLMSVAGLPFALSLGLLVGVFAKDQLGAVALLKGLLPVWTSLPILGFVLPEAWMWTQWPFANHWAVQGLAHALGDGAGVVRHALLALLGGLPVLAATSWLLARRLRLR